MQHIKLFDTKLYQDIYDNPNESLQACENCINKICEEYAVSMPGETSFSKYDNKCWQVLINIDKNSTPIRLIDTGYLEKIIKVSGIIVSVSRTFPKAISVKCKCSHCGFETTISNSYGGGSISLPR
mmetsp:Transcript_24105/g.20258  ORF Transcript_24105/g.20258 Transcript_24105/m.20258 type:complete len:126 (-) Transcript_24105:321-698(-)